MLIREATNPLLHYKQYALTPKDFTMRPLLCGFLLLFAVSMHAANTLKVTTWTKKTLSHALTIDFNYKNDDRGEQGKGFSLFAWRSLNDFLDNYLQTIRTQQLSIHPNLLIAPTIVDSGTASGIKYWRIYTEVLLAELKIKVACSLIVIASNPSVDGSYLIQSISMVKQENP
jgi:hypothetical protein